MQFAVNARAAFGAEELHLPARDIALPWRSGACICTHQHSLFHEYSLFMAQENVVRRDSLMDPHVIAARPGSRRSEDGVLDASVDSSYRGLAHIASVVAGWLVRHVRHWCLLDDDSMGRR